jgi:capsular polysaccharide biosynthesis protein
MQHPYGFGLKVAPDGFKRKLAWWTRRVLRTAWRYLSRPFDLVGLKRWRVMDVIWIKDQSGANVRDYRVMHAAQTVSIAQPGDEEFRRACDNYKSGLLQLPEVFVCELSPAFYYPALGLVANERFQVYGDSVLLPHRFHLSEAYRSIRPFRWQQRKGPVSSIQRIDAYNFWHWLADCLPQLLMLEKYVGDQPLTLLASDNLGGFQREMLSLMMAPNMTLEFVPAGTWIRTDRFILPSYLSGRCNGYLAEDYYGEMRRRITRGLGLPESGDPQYRLYLSRSGARRRRVVNEDAIIDSLRGYGFTAIRPETMSLRDQVSLFQRAEVIAGPHGAAFGGMVFATHAKVCVFYPERSPGEYFYTMARRLGLEHHALIHDYQGDEDSIEDFAIDQARMEALLEGPMGLTKR